MNLIVRHCKKHICAIILLSQNFILSGPTMSSYYLRIATPFDFNLKNKKYIYIYLNLNNIIIICITIVIINQVIVLFKIGKVKN